MMTGMVLGVAILISSSGVARAQEMQPALRPAVVFSFELPDALVSSTNEGRLNEQRPLWQRGSVVPAPSKSRGQFTKTDKVIAIAAGIAGGWIAGGYIGGAITNNYDNPDDDTSVLRGILIGAPIGAVVGAIVAHKLTK
jgi:hypothetical protein